MPTVALTLRVLLAVVLGWSSLSKLTASGRRGLGDMLGQLGFGRRTGLAGGALVVGEAGTAVLVLLPWTAAAGAVLAIALFAVLTAGVVVVLRKRMKVRCACFGSNGATLAPVHVVRNAILLLCAVAATATAWAGPVDSVAAVAVAAVAGGLLAVLLTRLDDLAFLIAPPQPLESR